MKIEYAEAVWLEEQPALDLAGLAETSGLPMDVVHELVECGVLAPLPSQPQWRFAGGCVTTVKTASRLRGDFDLDANALALVMRLMDRIHELESELEKTKAANPHHK